MGWKDHLLRLLARGALVPEGAHLESEAIVRAIGRVEADEELSQRLDAAPESEVREVFLALIAEEIDRTE